MIVGEDITYDRLRDLGEKRSRALSSGRKMPMLANSPISVYNVDFAGQKSIYGVSGSGSSTTIDHKTLRQNARAAMHESLQARSLVERTTDIVISTGLIVEPSPETDILGITPEMGEEWSANTGRRFHLWASSKRCSRDETMIFYQAQRLAGICQTRDNDYFVRLFYSKNRNLQNPLQFQFIDPDLIVGDAFTNTLGYQIPSDGIERDSSGREIAYNIQYWDGKEYINSTVPAFGRSGRRLMLHGFQIEYSNQGRGFSRIGHALQEFQQITGFTLAHIQKAINQSIRDVYVKPNSTAPSSNPFEEMTTNYGAGPLSSLYNQLPTPNSGIDTRVEFCDLQTAMYRRPGSVGVFTLQGGEDFREFKDTAPAENFASFVDSFVAYLAASVGMPFEVLMMRFNQNYSASRAALLLCWQAAEIQRYEIVSDFCNPIYEAWLSEEIAAGRILAPGWTDPILRQAWLSANWIGEPLPNIDPSNTADADMKYVQMGAQTLDRVSRKLNGSSGKANRAKLDRELGELPIPPWAGGDRDESTRREESEE